MWHQIRSALVLKVDESNLCSRCRDSGCEACLVGVSNNRIVINADKAMGHGTKKCDCVLFVQGGRNILIVLPVELKSGSITLNPAIMQLEAGAQYADKMVQTLPSLNELDLRCIAVLVHNSRLTIRQTQRLMKMRKRIEFGGKKWRVATARCSAQGDIAQLIAAQTADLASGGLAEF